MAVRTAPVEVPHGVEDRRGCWVTAGDVAGITYSRHAHLQQLRVVGAMRFVAVGTVFHDWWVLPQKRTATLRMTGKAVLVDCAMDELLRIGCSMRVMATGACHLAFAIGHVRGALQLRAPHLMTLETDFRLRFLKSPVLAQWSLVANVRG